MRRAGETYQSAWQNLSVQLNQVKWMKLCSSSSTSSSSSVKSSVECCTHDYNLISGVWWKPMETLLKLDWLKDIRQAVIQSARQPVCFHRKSSQLVFPLTIQVDLVENLCCLKKQHSLSISVWKFQKCLLYQMNNKRAMRMYSFFIVYRVVAPKYQIKGEIFLSFIIGFDFAAFLFLISK